MLSEKEKKRLYDIEYRRKNKEAIKQRNKKYNESPAGRAMQKRNRDKFKHKHLEYIRTNKYRAWKHEYDMEHRYKKVYGEYWECMQIVVKIEKLFIEKVPDKYERLKIRDYFNRKRDHINAMRRAKHVHR